MRAPKHLDECLNILDLRALARRRLPEPLFHYMEGAAETEFTAERNTSAFDRELLMPRVLVDVTSVSTSTRVLGQVLAWPVFCSPTGASRVFHPHGELAVARAAAGSGTLYGLSTMSTVGLEEVAAAAAGPKMFQLYIFKDSGITRELIARCKRTGYRALCLTVDAPVRGNRERELKVGMGIPIKLTGRMLASFAARPRWLLGQLRQGPMSMPNLASHAGGASMVANTHFVSGQLDASVSWADVGVLVNAWGGPFAIKGIVRAEDARRAADVGASAVIVSNHGGRQLDGAVAPIEVLPDIVDAVGDRVEVILDGGVRRGVHVLKALARGAKACSIGRPYLYGLAAGGERGVAKALEILRKELITAMKLSGCTTLNQIDSSLLRRL